ncbi:2-phospho-L-lactate transferase CofD family protein [Novosphingobium lubricantis]
MSIVVLTGGVGGAKLVLGLIHTLLPGEVTAIVNTGDDFTHLGLAISPDIDTLLYTLAGKANAAQGWGREGETGASWRRSARSAAKTGSRSATATLRYMSFGLRGARRASHCRRSQRILRVPGG